MMEKLQEHKLKIRLDREGARRYAKASYPIRYGRFAEVEYGPLLFQFNTNGEIRYISSTGAEWPHPAEWLKRTMGNDWVYYSTGSYYSGVVDLFGEYYLPCPAYSTNSLFSENPFASKAVAAALETLERISAFAMRKAEEAGPWQDFFRQISCNSPGYLRRRAEALYRILQARVTVLPPDCRHVDYDVIPLMISDGCLYNCSFCEVKIGQDLSCRSRSEIEAQLHGLREFFGPDLANYNSIYLGLHDALSAGEEDLLFAAEQAYTILDIKNSYMMEPRLFLFGSAESFLQTTDAFWRSLERLPFYACVNLGLESLDDATLEYLGKPVKSVVMQEAFGRMQEINARHEQIEITANFLLGEDLPATHLSALAAGLRRAGKGPVSRGCVYLSPLKGSNNTRDLLEQFRVVKKESRFQTFLYLIQRL